MHFWSYEVAQSNAPRKLTRRISEDFVSAPAAVAVFSTTSDVGAYALAASRSSRTGSTRPQDDSMLACGGVSRPRSLRRRVVSVSAARCLERWRAEILELRPYGIMFDRRYVSKAP
eukprot:6179041-Pleurochrysis_carterae.AAC.7